MTTLTKEADVRLRATRGERRGAFLSVRDLYVHFATEDGTVKAVDGLSFDLERGTHPRHRRRVRLRQVGDQPVDPRAAQPDARPTSSGEILLDGQELTGAPEKTLESLRGNKMAMIFQDPLTALSPYYTVGRQIAEPYRKHMGASKREARLRAVEMLDQVGIPNAETRVDDYPHQFSGGMRQRAMIAMALVCNPDLLIADEPTTALDVTVQAQILDLLKDLQQEFGSAIIFITHDLGVVANVADDILVMYGGRAVERGTRRARCCSAPAPLHLGPADLHAAAVRRRRRGARPDQRHPAEPARAAARLPVPPALRLRGRGGRRHVAAAATGPRCPDGRGAACHLTAEQKQTFFVEQIKPRLS